MTDKEHPPPEPSDPDTAPEPEPDKKASEAPDTEPVPVSEDAAREPEPAPAGGWHRSVVVPMWVIAALALIVVGGLAFGVGRWTAPSDASESDSEVSVDPGGPPDELPAVIPNPGDGPVLGVSVEDATDPSGAEVVRVLDDGPAADAGLEEGDVITAVDGDSVESAEDLVERIRSHDSGDEVTVTYTRSGDSQEVDVELSSLSGGGSAS